MTKKDVLNEKSSNSTKQNGLDVKSFLDSWNKWSKRNRQWLWNLFIGVFKDVKEGHKIILLFKLCKSFFLNSSINFIDSFIVLFIFQLAIQ